MAGTVAFVAIDICKSFDQQEKVRVEARTTETLDDVLEKFAKERGYSLHLFELVFSPMRHLVAADFMRTLAQVGFQPNSEYVGVLVRTEDAKDSDFPALDSKQDAKVDRWADARKKTAALYLDDLLDEDLIDEDVDKDDIEHYRMFLTVKAIDRTLPPPDVEVDKIWHKHILQTRKYAEDCQLVFGEFLHHDAWSFNPNSRTRVRKQMSEAFPDDCEFSEVAKRPRRTVKCG
eukprot:TRINITY_DN431_c0_g1_i1.p1 TRINITY_DN431_c0_g1~~TRINITY_DN431_c0_g1_i1.p1  ORF type:complete len:232 (+),score=15.46 TRINITY_DN431_c0_g1_i1:172-867(+)